MKDIKEGMETITKKKQKKKLMKIFSHFFSSAKMERK